MLAIGILLGISVPLKNLWQQRQNQVFSNKAILNAKTVEIGAPFVGIIAESFVIEGQTVREGQSLLRLETQNAESKINELIAQKKLLDTRLAEAHATFEFEKVEANFEFKISDSELKICREKLREYTNRIPFVQSKHDRAKLLNKKAAISVADFHEIRQDLSDLMQNKSTQDAHCQRAKNKSLLAKLKIDSLEARKLRLKVLESEQQVILVQIQTLKREIERAKIKAPFDARVVSTRVDVGSSVRPANTLMILSPVNQTFVEAWVDESSLAEIRKGNAVKISLNAKATVFHGSVEAICPLSNIHQYADATAPARKRTSLWLENSKVKLRIKLNDSANLASLPLGCSAIVSIEKD